MNRKQLIYVILIFENTFTQSRIYVNTNMYTESGRVATIQMWCSSQVIFWHQIQPYSKMWNVYE